jgi:hypothetical protein
MTINDEKAGLFESAASKLFSNMQQCLADFARLCEKEQ